LLPTQTGVVYIQIYNGSLPLLQLESFTVSPKPVVQPTVVTYNAKKKIIYLYCYKGKSLRIAYGVNPICPVGFAVKKQS
jgi:hypothetical protein